MQVIAATKALASTSADVKRLFRLISARSRHWSEMNVDAIERELGIARRPAIDLARSLEGAGLGRLVIGRRGGKSRFQWAHNSIEVAKAAIGDEDRGVKRDETQTMPQRAAPIQTDPTPDAPISIAGMLTEAKEDLSRRLGIPVSAIEIKITM